MGLKSNRHGVKAELKMRFPQAFREFDNLVDARNASMASREQCVAFIDGNVLLHSVPQNAHTIDAYVAIVTNNLKKAIATSFVTIVVFDEPACLTEAKAQEQKKRDAARQSVAVNCSSDLADPTPTDDDYQKQHIASTANVHTLVHNRRTRLRFFDEVAMRVLSNLQSLIDRWQASGFEGGNILFDGIDPRGADRPLKSAREPQMFGSCEKLATTFKRSISIGEGDLKLADLGRRTRELCLGSEEEPSPFHQVKLCLCTTIDTDSFAIELLEEAKKCKEIPKAKRPLHTLLCMKERAAKRGRDDDREPFFLCCDVSLLQALLQQHLWGISRSPSLDDRHAAMTLLCTGWALCGCDFVEAKGMRSDFVFESLPELLKTDADLIDAIKSAWSGKREDVDNLYGPIRKIAQACAPLTLDVPRANPEHTAALRDLDDMIVRRAAWVSCYWNSCEFKGSMEDFGFFRSECD